MNTPEQQQIDHWLTVSRRDIDQTWQAYKDGYYKREDIPIQSVYTGTAMDYADLAHAKFLNGDTLASVRREFATAAECIIKGFTMAYDPSDPDYVGDEPAPEESNGSAYGYVDWADVGETTAIEGFNYALMAADFDLGRKLAHWFQDPGDGDPMAPDVNRYTHALKYALLGEKGQGSALLQQTIDEYTAQPPSKDSGAMNYFTLSLTLSGILRNDETLFNQGLALILKFYREVMIPSEDMWDPVGSRMIT